MTKIISALTSVVMFLSIFFLGLTNTAVEPVDYGGTPYVPPVIEHRLNLVENGESAYVIVKAMNCPAAETTAADELQKYIALISGKTLPIVPDSALPAAPEIVVGDTNRTGGAAAGVKAALGEEGYDIRVEGANLFISGGGPRGTLYGVYDFLEQCLGCRWFTAELECVPRAATLSIDAALCYSEKPAFEYRYQDWRCSLNTQWQAKMRINGGYMGEPYGGGVTYADFCHSMERLVPESYFETHPEYFSYREEEGARTLAQRCLTNPDVLAITVNSARAALLANPEAEIMSITQNDNQDYCQCPACKASDALYGGPSGTNIRFVNAVAEALEAEFPAVMFDTFAYQYTRKPPVNVTPRQNVVVRLCSIECCFCHPLSECGHVRDESVTQRFRDVEPAFANDLLGWSAISGKLYVWDYTTNYQLYLNPFPNFHVLQPNMQFFAENNVKGVFEEGNAASVSGEFGELRAYLIAKLLWDPYCDVEHEMMDFMQAYYGENAAAPIKEYIDIITNKAVKTEHMFIFDWHDQGVYFGAKERIHIDALWDKAEAAAVTPVQLANVQRSRLSFRQYKANLLLDEFSPLNPYRISENKKLYTDIVAAGITEIHISHPILENPDFFLTPVNWS